MGRCKGSLNWSTLFKQQEEKLRAEAASPTAASSTPQHATQGSVAGRLVRAPAAARTPQPAGSAARKRLVLKPPRRKDKRLSVRGLMALDTQTTDDSLRQDAAGLVRALMRRFRATADPRGEAERLLAAAWAQSRAQASRPGILPALLDGEAADRPS